MENYIGRSVHGRVCQRVFFPVVCGENWATKLRSWRAGFFPAHHDRGFAGKQQEKNPLASRVSFQLPSLYNVYKEKPIFQNITKKHVHVIFPVLILFVQGTHMERILTGLGGLVWKILHASRNIQLRVWFSALMWKQNDLKNFQEG